MRARGARPVVVGLFAAAALLSQPALALAASVTTSASAATPPAAASMSLSPNASVITSRPQGGSAGSVVPAYVAALSAAAAPAGSPGGDLVKVYVVKTAQQNGGTPDSLPVIAARTLGDAGRAGEIFELNRGRTQPDGSALQDPNQLRPGWILRLPQDAGGPDVRLARETGGGNDAGDGGNGGDGNATAPADGATGAPPAGDPAPQADGRIALPLAAVLAVLGAVLLGLLTAAIVFRRRLRRAFAWLPRLVHRLGEPRRRARRLAFRRGLAQTFAADAESLRVAHRIVAELSGPKGYAVHAVSVDDAGATVWVGTQDDPPAPWQDLGGSRWRLPAGALDRPVRAAAPVPGAPTSFLVRVGVDDQGGKVFVDLSRLDGLLSVTGDHQVATDVVTGLLTEVARGGPGIPAAVLSRTGATVALPQAMPRVEAPRPGSVEIPAAGPQDDLRAGTLRAAAHRRFLRAMLVVPEAPQAGDAAELAALCAEAIGWTGLVCGDVDGAHWRWQAAQDGSVRIPALRLTVSAPAAA
ncbi:hypothetical protein Sme01_68530 [Sphaerisporangium melleum]|nr:hypothetical protein Sme01_68530 [Sphaerisporangium melleum]